MDQKNNSSNMGIVLVIVVLAILIGIAGYVYLNKPDAAQQPGLNGKEGDSNQIMTEPIDPGQEMPAGAQSDGQGNFIYRK